MKKIFKVKYIFIIVTIILTNIFSTAFSQNMDKMYEKIDLFSEVLEKVQDEYVDEIDQAEVMDSAINGVLQSLDPYSAYMSPKIFEEMETETSGKFGGLGIEVSMEAGVVKVITPIDDTPAARAGIKAGDYIVRINGEQVQGKTLMQAVNLMRGPIGSSIEITIRRKGLKKAKIFKITREIIEIRSVVSKSIDNKIGYLRLRAFNENSSNQLKKKFQS
jgi:carboxyl-terminal processing protease